jgi:hypothetical protein
LVRGKICEGIFQYDKVTTFERLTPTTVKEKAIFLFSDVILNVTVENVLVHVTVFKNEDTLYKASKNEHDSLIYELFQRSVNRPLPIKISIL